MANEFEVWKTPITNGPGLGFVKLPRGAKPLCLQLQDGKPTIWWQVNPDEPQEKHYLNITGTGWRVKPGNERYHYIGTWQSGGLVWHAYFRERVAVEAMPSYRRG